ncbi:hypothetical protein [Nonomuraea typhae]|uniref:hypothetical protein n=1 Tax=Nonomuraea typhae TaxID=2603600 RepID=UPI0012F86ED8|nr:hypothetical protein [Nonomuraea typhae]
MGLVLGALTVAAVGVILGGIVQGLVPLPVRLASLGLLAGAVLLRELGLIRLPVPENARLVPEHVLERGRALGGIQFGFEMGTGMRTYSPSAQPHLVLAAVLLMLPWDGALAAGAGFAAARWIMAAASIGHSEDGGWSDLWQIHARLLAAATAIATVGSLAWGLWPR